MLPLLALLALPAAALENTVECPAGTHRISTDDPYAPFRCVKDDEGKKKASGFGSVTGPKGFSARPKCPHGTRQVAGDALQPYRCVRAGAAEAEPELTPLRSEEEEALPPPVEEDDPLRRGCPPGKRKVRTTDPLNPYQCVVQAARIRSTGEDSYVRFEIPRELSFEYPRTFRLQDGWREDVPSLSLSRDDGSLGKPVSITITKFESRQPTYQDLDVSMTRDIEWQKAKDGGVLTVAAIRSRVTYVPGDTRTVYVPLSNQSYFTFIYSAPAEAYEANLPAFQRLLKSLKLSRKE